MIILEKHSKIMVPADTFDQAFREVREHLPFIYRIQT
jgi:hypothetical protein